MTTNQSIIEDFTLVPVPQWWQNPWLWFAFLAVAGASIYFFRRWLKSRPVAYKPPKPSATDPAPHLEALRRLEDLRGRHAKLTAYQVALECSDILRRYIEGRFAAPIRFQTTREFLGAIHDSPELNGDSRAELGNFLRFFDGLKFAQDAAAASETSNAIDGAERFVRRCIPTAPAA